MPGNKFISGVFLLFFYLLPARLFSTCKCDSFPAFEKVYERAHVIFRGKAVSVSPNWMSGGNKITFKASESWKRNIEPFFTFNTGDPANCGLIVQEDEEWLIFVIKSYGYSSDVCSGSVRIRDANEFLSILGKGLEPGTNPSARKEIWLMGILVLLGLLFLLFVVVRKKIFR